MRPSKWIWRAGDFGRYHGMLLHNRRTIQGIYYGPMWRIDPPACNVLVYKIAELNEPETMIAYANTAYASVIVNGARYPMGREISLQAGRNFVKLQGFKENGFPAFYCIGNTFASDESWHLGSWGAEDAPVGTSPMYTELGDDPQAFKFSYQRLRPVSSRPTAGGTLYDFGKECFGRLILEHAAPCQGTLTITPGESEEEALDADGATIRLSAEIKDGSYISDTVALRYVFVPDFGEYELSLDFEYLPLPKPSEFHASDERLNKIREVAAYTLHLNAREAFFDGIKRDRWVWGGDAYQSYFVNYYLWGDNDIVRRTQRILCYAEPMTQHINQIPDYTFYWFMAMEQYDLYTGDRAFLREMYPTMLRMMDFVRSRLDADGLYTKRDGDWVFVDWHTFDKDAGPISAEQMLLCKAYAAMAKTASVLNDIQRSEEYTALAAELKEKINRLYWDDEKGSFIDSEKTGNRIVTRHANIFALLYDLTDEERKLSIVQNVIENAEIPPITTPYFEFFELDAMCKLGRYDYMTDMLRSYWGGMLDLGATTFWEEYFPGRSRVENYAMYGRPYGKSLCHAWSASPIYLLSRYGLGVYPTAPAYARYEVCPSLLGLSEMKGTVPTPKGTISVTLTPHEVTIFSELDGGTLILDDMRIPIERNETLTVKI